MTRFRHRSDAGRQLARELTAYRGAEGVVVLGLPRGGVPVAFEIATKPHAPLDVFVVRKLGVPCQPELATGAIASGGVRVLKKRVIDALGIDKEILERVAACERAELDRRAKIYRDKRKGIELRGGSVIVVDDGLATGASTRAAAQALRALGASRIVVAVPVAPAESCRECEKLADEIVCLSVLQQVDSIGEWYEDFTQTSDEEVKSLLVRARENQTA